MAYVSVPKDLTRVKTKVIFNLSKRQIVCFGGGALIGVPLFFWLRPGLGSSPAAICMMLAMLPFFLLGLYENNGRPLEKVLRDVADTLVRRPKARPYRTNNVYGALMRQEAIDKEVRKPGARKLTHEEKEQIKAVIRKNRPNGRQPGSAQETIPYDRIWPDGICLARGWYTKTLQFQDINYQLSHNDAKSAIFEGWCDFLNYFDSSIHLQFSFLNRNADADRFENCIHIPVRRDGAERIRSEYAQILSNQLARGSNGIERVKYLTFGIRADSLKTARARLDRIELDVLANFKRMGVAASLLDGRERLHLLHRIFHTDTQEPFRFEWEWLAPSGLSTKDFVAPSSFAFGESRRFRMGGTLGAVSVLQILAPELNDRMLADFLDIDASLIVTMHIQSIDQNAAIKQIKRKITDLDKTKMEEQKRAVRAGYDMDILPSDLATYGAEAKKLLEDLQSRNERMFLVTFLVLNTGTNRQALENMVFQAQGVAQKYNCQLTRLDFQQEKALAASLPLGVNELEIQRALTTSSTAIFVPFTTQELFQTTGEPMYYGLNALSNNMIMADRKQLKNPNGLILGTPGSGKSFSAKREITNCYLLTDDDILICDPEAEYAPLVEALRGQVIRISPSCRELVFGILPDGEMVGLSLAQFLKFKVHVVLEVLIVLPYLHAADHFNQGGEVTFLRGQLVMDKADQGRIKQHLGLLPEIVPAFALAFGVGHEAAYELEDVLLAVNVGKGVVMMGLAEVDGVENLDAVPLPLQESSALYHHASLRVLSIRNKKKVSCF